MTSFIDRQGRLFGKVSLVDIVIVIAVIVLVFLAFVRFSKPAVAEVPVVATFTIEKVRDATVDQIRQALQNGFELYDDGGALLGTITDVVMTPTPLDVLKDVAYDDSTAATSQPAPDAVVVEGASKIYSDIQVTVKGKGVASSGTITVSGVVMRAGKPLVIVGNGLEVKATIMMIGVDKT